MLSWCRKYRIELLARHIPGVENVLADSLSRRQMVMPQEWSLHQKVADLIFQVLGRPHVDLFASTGNQKLLSFYSRFPEQEAYATEALEFNWKNIWAYAFPPMAILPIVINKIRDQGATVILIAPMWPRRTWYPEILQLLVDFPYQLPKMSNLLSQHKGRCLHPNPEIFHLVAWKLSGVPSLRKEFQQQLLKQSSQQRQVLRTKGMSVAGEIFVPGANKKVLIPVIQLSLR
jgi:hypothetical protein